MTSPSRGRRGRSPGCGPCPRAQTACRPGICPPDGGRRTPSETGRVDVMAFHLTDAERSRLRSMVKRPRSRKQLYRAEALLALDEGQPIETVARKFRVGVERVEHWVSGFEKLRMAFLAEPDAGRPKGQDDSWDPDEAGAEDEDEQTLP